MDLDAAYKHCMDITRRHYENFPVASLLIPSKFRPHISAVYAFARTADDFADEKMDREKLLDWRRQLHRCLEAPPENPVFQALAHTIRRFDIPVQLLDDLITAFLQDLDKNRFSTFEELFDYCRYSANPVGRIVLQMFGFDSEKTLRYSDAITTALQLTNFWQDISVDLSKDRIYIPEAYLNQYMIREEEILQRQFSPNFALLMTQLLNQTRELYHKGAGLFGHISGRLKWELKFTVLGGMAVLQKVVERKADILHHRPSLSGKDWSRIALRAAFNGL